MEQDTLSNPNILFALLDLTNKQTKQGMCSICVMNVFNIASEA